MSQLRAAQLACAEATRKAEGAIALYKEAMAEVARHVAERKEERAAFQLLRTQRGELEREVARLARDIESQTTARKDMDRVAGEWAIRADRAEAEVARLTADKERLDWLDRANHALNEAHGTKYGWKYDANHNRLQIALTDCNIPAFSIRSAIDDVRAEEGGE